MSTKVFFVLIMPPWVAGSSELQGSTSSIYFLIGGWSALLSTILGVVLLV